MARIKKAESSLFPHGSEAARKQVILGEQEAKKKRKTKKRKKKDEIDNRVAGRVGR